MLNFIDYFLIYLRLNKLIGADFRTSTVFIWTGKVALYVIAKCAS